MNTKAPTATEIHARLFDRPREPRSQAYKDGALAAIRYRLEGVESPLPHEPGTPERDAWLSGYAEGRDACRGWSLLRPVNEGNEGNELERFVMSTKQKPTGFIARCQCGKIVGALDYARTDRKEAGRLLGGWLHEGCTIEPRFAGTWSATVEGCDCSDS